MDRSSTKMTFAQRTYEFLWGGELLPGRRVRRAFWQVRLRWWAPLAITIGVGLGWRLGYRFPMMPILWVAAGILFYNCLFSLAFQLIGKDPRLESKRERLYTILMVVCDYAAMFLLIHLTGGAASPVTFFFIFHIIIAAILFRPSTAFLFAAVAIVGIGLHSLWRQLDYLADHPITYETATTIATGGKPLVLLTYMFFAATVLVTAAISTRLMSRLHRRVVDLAEATRKARTLNDELSSLYAMLKTVGSERQLQPVLDIMTAELAIGMDVTYVAVKLLEADGDELRFVSAYGLPEEFLKHNSVHISTSSMNRRVIEGEVLVSGNVDEEDDLQLHNDLEKAGIKSMCFAPLTLDKQVIGILAAYSLDRDRFSPEDCSFLRLAAELIAIAIENARAFQSIGELMGERNKFMLQVTHNMRAPIGACLGMLDLLSGDFLGEVSDEQGDYLGRIERRLKVLNRAIGELLTLAQTRDGKTDIAPVHVEPDQLAREVEQDFREEAESKGLEFIVDVAGSLPGLSSGADLLRQVLDNLVSNAIKYTESGWIHVTFALGSGGQLKIIVADSGIGIPMVEQPKLFTEFFRATNAKKMEAQGTGLGLALVKQAVNWHGGHLHFKSEEGKGTMVIVELPIDRAVGARN